MYLVGIAIVIILAAGIYYSKQGNKASTNTASNTPTNAPAPSFASPAPTVTSSLVEPVANFKQRVTKKPFGMYITPQNSPIQPEKFTGYHTGADAEYGDVTSDVPVHAVADGKVVLARWASGYGGVVAIQHQINGQPVIGIYGHLNPNQLPKVGTQVKAGEQIGILGKAFSHETDGERRHLHFGLFKGTTVNILGYVQTKAELAKWLDPLTVF